MRYRKQIALLGSCLLLAAACPGQARLQPGFNVQEYIETLEAGSANRTDTGRAAGHIPPPEKARLVYRSPETGLYNRWDLWLRNDQVGIISIRGTVGNKDSWLENFYAGMIPATGSLQLDDTTIFRYRLARDSNAYAHAGWTLALAYLAPGIVAKIKEYYRKGVHEYIVTGHSQGGAISFLLRSYLYYLDDPELPKDIVYKTYSSAAPKPGNLYYVYDYDYITRNGWGFRVVNMRDWVPETPFSVQTTNDFNHPNPFMNVKGALRKQSLLVRLVLRSMYNRLDRSTKKASRRMQKMLGARLYPQVKGTLPGYRRPPFVNSHTYMPAGVPVILYPDTAYDERFRFDGKNIFIHHMFEPYKYLAERIYGQETPSK